VLIEPVNFIPPGCAFVNVSITHCFGQFRPHRHQALISRTKYFFFKLLELSQIQIFLVAGELAFFLFDLFFVHPTSGRSPPGLSFLFRSILCGMLIRMRLLSRWAFLNLLVLQFVRRFFDHLFVPENTGNIHMLESLFPMFALFVALRAPSLRLHSRFP
jgi:hypothetical protein